MSESDDFDDEDLLFEDEAAARVGHKVIEMANRVADMHAAIPGARATWHLEIDDRRYRVVVMVVDAE